MARAPIPRPLNIGQPSAPPMIGGLGLPPELMNPRPMAPQGPGIAPPTFTRNMPQNAPQLPSAPTTAMAASAVPMSAPATGGMGSRIGDFLGSDAALALSAGILEGGTTSQALGRGMGYALAARQAAQKPAATTDDIREYALAKQEGYTGNFTDFMTMTRKAGATQVNVGQSEYGTIPQGYQLQRGPDGSLSMSPIPGGPEDTSEADAINQQGKERQADIVTQDIDRALSIIDTSPAATTGPGGALLQNIPGTQARDLKALIDTVKSNVGFDKLQAMRDASPTGGALGQVSEQENRLLQATIGNLEQSQTTAQLRDNLNRVWNVYQDIVHGPGNGPARRPLGFESGPVQDGWQDMGNGVRVREMP